MKATGIVRQVDQLGRVVIPITLRRRLGIGLDEPVEFFMDGQSIVLKKYQPACVFCGAKKGLQEVLGKNVCGNCMEKMKSL